MNSGNLQGISISEVYTQTKKVISQIAGIRRSVLLIQDIVKNGEVTVTEGLIFTNMDAYGIQQKKPSPVQCIETNANILINTEGRFNQAIKISPINSNCSLSIQWFLDVDMEDLTIHIPRNNSVEEFQLTLPDNVFNISQDPPTLTILNSDYILYFKRIEDFVYGKVEYPFSN